MDHEIVFDRQNLFLSNHVDILRQNVQGIYTVCCINFDKKNIDDRLRNGKLFRVLFFIGYRERFRREIERTYKTG